MLRVNLYLWGTLLLFLLKMAIYHAGTPTAKSLRSFYFKCGAPWLASDALQYVGVDMHACAFVCIYFEKLRDWVQEKLYLK